MYHADFTATQFSSAEIAKDCVHKSQTKPDTSELDKILGKRPVPDDIAAENKALLEKMKERIREKRRYN